jgi:hypothetical protein
MFGLSSNMLIFATGILTGVSIAAQFAVHVLGGRGAMLAAMTGTTISVPGSGSLAPGSQCYLPIAAARCVVWRQTGGAHANALRTTTSVWGWQNLVL